MTELLFALILKEPVSNFMIEQALSEICGNLHSGDCDYCPVVEANGRIPQTPKSSCTVFKDGKKMMTLIKSALEAKATAKDPN